MNNHKQVDIFGKQCAPVIGLNQNDCPVIQVGEHTRRAATAQLYPNITSVLDQYAESADGSFNFLIEMKSILYEKQVFLLKMDAEYMHYLFGVLESETKDGQLTYKVIVSSDVKDSDIVYDQIEFLNMLCHNYFGFECIRSRKIHQRIGTFFSNDSVLVPIFSSLASDK
ncbi:MAG: hypothetical protein WD512_13430 [Candidatus Paceibacterota bacterium]